MAQTTWLLASPTCLSWHHNHWHIRCTSFRYSHSHLMLPAWLHLGHTQVQKQCSWSAGFYTLGLHPLFARESCAVHSETTCRMGSDQPSASSCQRWTLDLHVWVAKATVKSAVCSMWSWRSPCMRSTTIMLQPCWPSH